MASARGSRRIVFLSVALGAALLFLLTACSTDASTPTTNDAGSAGNAGDSGTSGSGGLGGAAGASGQPVDAGSDGTAGLAGNAGAAAQGGSAGAAGLAGSAGAAAQGGSAGAAAQGGNAGAAGLAGSAGTAGLGGNGGAAGGGPTLDIVDVTPHYCSFGTTQQFTATGVWSNYMTIDLTDSCLWASSSPTVVTVSNAPGTRGLATAVSSGTTIISATCQGVVGTAFATISIDGIVSITVTPANATLGAGETLQFTAFATYPDASTQDISSMAAWSSSLPSVATISSSGLVTAVGPGSTQISASYLSLAGVTSLSVTP